MNERNYIARYRCTYCGTYEQEIRFKSRYRANSRANKRDAKMEIIRRYEKGIALNSTVLETWLER